MSERSKQEIDKQALDESIIKWEAIVREYEKGNKLIDFSSWENDTNASTGLLTSDCPLCILYPKECTKCPLSENNERCGRIGGTWDNYDIDRNITTATAMLNKLKELRRAYD